MLNLLPMSISETTICKCLTFWLAIGIILCAAQPLQAQFSEVAKLLASDRETRDFFGGSVSISGDRAIVGADGEDTGGGASGAAYIFERDAGGNWNEVTKLKGSSIADGDFFGTAVSISGDRAIVGANADDTGKSNSGSAYIFERDASGNWNEVAKLQAGDNQIGLSFGVSVSISGERAIIGAIGDDNGGINAGSAYIFERDAGGNWNQVAKIQANDRAGGDRFGISVAVSGEKVIVGADNETTAGQHAGAAYIFERDINGNWNEVAKLLPNDVDINDSFGSSVSISGNRAIVGTPAKDHVAGVAYIFERDGSGNWSEIQKIQASDKDDFDAFGISVSISGERAIIGAYHESSGGSGAGAAYIFERDGSGNWSETQKIQASDRKSDDYFGNAVAISDEKAIAGAYWEFSNGIGGGAAYIFETPQQATAHYPYVLFATERISASKYALIEGDIHANEEVELKKGSNSVVDGNITAVEEIEIDKKNTVTGDVSAPEIDNDGTITGAQNLIAVAPIALPVIAPFSTGDTDIEVDKNATLDLAPGSYDDIEVKKGGTLRLSPGIYNAESLELDKNATLEITGASGAATVTINLDESLEIGKNGKIITPGGRSQNVTINITDDDDVEIGKNAEVNGCTMIAPDALVVLEKNSFFKGAICAKEIEVNKNARAVVHGSSALPKIFPDSEGDSDGLTAIPQGYQLEQNYPNPFNPTTTIRFGLPEAGNVSLKIFNVNGQLVKTLASGSFAAGQHQVVWDATDQSGAKVSSGMYLYLLRINNFQQVRKMLLMK